MTTTHFSTNMSERDYEVIAKGITAQVMHMAHTLNAYNNNFDYVKFLDNVIERIQEARDIEVEAADEKTANEETVSMRFSPEHGLVPMLQDIGIKKL